MTRAGKAFTVIGVLVATIFAGWLLLIGTVVAVGGVMTVELVDRSEGFDIFVPIPMALVDAAVASATTPAIHTAGFPRMEVDGVSVDFGELGPVVLELFEELDDLPDATLVEVVDGRESVRISKRGSKFLVEVEDPSASISVSLPTRGALRVAERILG